LILSDVYAFGSFRLKTTSTDKGFEVFDELFADQVKHYTPDNARELNVAMADYLETLGSNKGGTSYCSPKGISALENLARLYLSHPEIDFIELDFSQILRRNGAKDAVNSVIGKAIEAPDGTGYAVLSRSAYVWRSLDSKRALELLKKAEPLLPQNDQSECRRFYTAYVDLLVKASDFAQAVETQAKLVKLTGAGQQRLAVLQYQAGDKDAITRSIAAIDYANLSEEDLRELVAALLKAKQSDSVIAVLNGYVAAPRARDVAQELWARHTLAGLLLARKETAEALVVLKSLPPETDKDTPRSRMERRLIGRLAKSIEEKPENKR
jgi:hypothetical protein